MKKLTGHIDSGLVFDSNTDYSELTSVGGYIFCRNATLPENAFPQLTSVGGAIDCRNATVPENAFPQLTSVGGHIDCRNATVPASFKSAKHNDSACSAKEESKIGLLKSFLNSGYLFADGILSRVISKRSFNGAVVWKIVICGSIKVSYVIESEGVYSHGATIKEAKDSFVFKITDRDTSKYKSWGVDTLVSAAEAISSYRAITGACEQGVRKFCQDNSVDLDGEILVSEIIKITKGHYGSEQYREFFESND